MYQISFSPQIWADRQTDPPPPTRCRRRPRPVWSWPSRRCTAGWRSGPEDSRASETEQGCSHTHTHTYYTIQSIHLNKESRQKLVPYLSTSGGGPAVFGADPVMVKTGQGLVLEAATGSRPPPELLLDDEPAANSILLFSGRWTPGLWLCADVWVFAPLLWPRRRMCSFGCGCLAESSGGGRDSVRSSVVSGTLTQWWVLALPSELPVSVWCSWTWTPLWFWFSGWASEPFVFFWRFGPALLTDQSLATKGVLGVLGWRIMGVLGWKWMGALRWRRMGILGWGLMGVTGWEDEGLS